MMNPRTNFMLFVAGAALVCSMVLSPGCEKKKPPPPPPPPPAPVEPVEVSFDTIMQTLRADPRVQAAANLGITDESFAISAVKFADAFARGDAQSLKGMMQNRAKGVLELLENDGTWSTLAGRIEAVRIVYAGSPGAVGDLERQQGIAQMRAMLPAQLKNYEDVLIKRGMDINEIARYMEEFKKEIEEAVVNAQLESAMNSAMSGDSAALSALASLPNADENPEMAMLVAVQTPEGAELLGWTARKAGDAWIFNNASTLSTARVKAKDWDGVGMFGFSLGIGQAAAEASTPRRPGEGPGPSTTTAPAPVRDTGAPPEREGTPERPKLPDRDPRRLIPGN